MHLLSSETVNAIKSQHSGVNWDGEFDQNSETVSSNLFPLKRGEQLKKVKQDQAIKSEQGQLNKVMASLAWEMTVVEEGGGVFKE